MFYWREALIHQASQLPFMQLAEGEQAPPSDGQCHISHTHTHTARERERTHTNAQKQLSGGLLHSTDQTITPYTHTHTHTVLSVRTTQTKQEIHPFSILCSFCLKWTFETSQWQIFYKKKESLSDCNHPQSAVHVPRSIAGISHLTKCFFFLLYIWSTATW